MGKKRLTTDQPQGMHEYTHNMTKVINGEVYLRNFCDEGDKSLVEYCKEECKSRCKIDVAPGVGAEEFGEYMECDCVVAHFYFLAVGHAELRLHLKQYEDAEEEEKVKS